MALPKNPRKCRVCKGDFQPVRALQNVCSPDCAIKAAAITRGKAERVAALADRKTIRIRKDKAKTRSQWMREAQAAFNAFIRIRDRVAGRPCVSSGNLLDWSGNNVDAGHYRSVGSAPHLRFDEQNCHAQSKHDNRYLSGNAVDYRKGLIDRIGMEALDRLESDNDKKKYSIDDLSSIKEKYKSAYSKLKKQLD